MLYFLGATADGTKLFYAPKSSTALVSWTVFSGDRLPFKGAGLRQDILAYL